MNLGFHDQRRKMENHICSQAYVQGTEDAKLLGLRASGPSLPLSSRSVYRQRASRTDVIDFFLKKMVLGWTGSEKPQPSSSGELSPYRRGLGSCETWQSYRTVLNF